MTCNKINASTFLSTRKRKVLYMTVVFKVPSVDQILGDPQTYGIGALRICIFMSNPDGSDAQ